MHILLDFYGHFYRTGEYECLIMFYRAKQIVYAVPSFKAKWTSINNKSLPEPYADPFYKDEREKRSVFDFHPRENSRMLQNQLNYSPFTSYNYYDISQHSTHFHLVLLREVFWQKKQTLLINWYVSCANRKNRAMLY